MSILITGAGGFIGRELLSVLADSGEELVALDYKLGGIAERQGLTCVEADLCDRATLARLFDGSVNKVVHLAAVPGGAAEADPAASKRVNIDATLDLLDLAAAQGNCPRVVFASTIAVFGDMPSEGVDDATALRPQMIYGMHKAMIEIAMATLSRRGAIDGISLRLPGILARPLGPSGMKSAYMSEIFHALKNGQPYTLPVSTKAQMWLMSVTQCARNLAHALSFDTGLAPENRVATLPALRVSMQELVHAILRATGADPGLVSYEPDLPLEAAFGSQPPLETRAAAVMGMKHDGDIPALVANALAVIDQQGS